MTTTGHPAAGEVGTEARTTAIDETNPQAPWLLGFLRAELAGSPARVRATARIVLSCTLALTLVMTLQIPHGTWAIATIFVVSLPDAGATLRKAMQRVVGTLAGCAAAILTVAAAADIPWLRLPIGCIVGGFSVFLGKTTAAPYAAMLGGFTYLMFTLGSFGSPEEAVATGLWRALVISLGVLVVLLVDLLLLPSDPEERLLDDLEQRLGAIEGALARALGAERADTEPAAALDRLLLDLPRELDLLASAEARHAPLRRIHAEQLASILAVERLLTAAHALERVRAKHATQVVPAPLAARLRALLEAVARSHGRLARRADDLADGAASSGRGRVEARVRAAPPGAVPVQAEVDEPTAPQAPGVADAHGGSAALLAVLVDLEDAQRLLDRSLAPPDGALASSPAAALPPSPLDAPATSWLTPDFSLANLAGLRIGMKTALALLLFYLLMVGLDWPGIMTGLVTVTVLANTTSGAVLHKAVLRLSGAVLGGAAAIALIAGIMPNLTSLPALLLAVTPCFAAAAWVTAGGPRISYVGFQAGFALALGLLGSLGPTIDFEPARDRIVGILLGDVVGTVVFLGLWPVSATREMCRSLGASIGAVADLCRVGSRNDAPAPVAPARGYRWQAYQRLAETTVLLDEAAFEVDAGRAANEAARDAVRRVLPLVQEAFLSALAVVRHRIAVDLSAVPQELLVPLRACSSAAAQALDAFVRRLAQPGIAESPEVPLDLRPLLAAARRAVEQHRASRPVRGEEAETLAHLGGRLDLLGDLAELIERLDRETSRVAAAIAAAAGAPP